MRRIERDPVPYEFMDDTHLADVVHEDDECQMAPRGLVNGLVFGAVMWVLIISAIVWLRGK